MPNVPSAYAASEAAIFGTGTDGAATLDGATGVAWASLAANVYTMNRDAQLTNLTINAGVTLKPSNFRIFCSGTLTNNGTITAAGNPAAAGAGGGSQGSASTVGGRGGGAGGTGVSGAGANGTSAVMGSAGGAGGAGTSGGAGAGGTVTGPSANTTLVNLLQVPDTLLAGEAAYQSGNQVLGWGAGGGGGGSDAASNAGGGGGGGGGVVGILARSVNNGAGVITAAGGAGAAGTGGNAGGGGGGAGGLIAVYTTSPWVPGTTNVAGGALGAGVGTGANGIAGGAGIVVNSIVQ